MWPSVMAFCCGLLLRPSGLVPSVEGGLLVWTSGEKGTTPEGHLQQKATTPEGHHQKATTAEGHHRKGVPGGDPLQAITQGGN